MPRNSRRVWQPACAAVVLLAMLPLCGGCDNGPPRAAVRGMVTLGGEPLKQGVIQFVPLDEGAGPKYSLPIVDGQFEAPAAAGPPAGNHRIEIQSTYNGGYAPDDEQAVAKIKAAGKRLETVQVPRKYNRQSELKAELLATGVNELEFKLDKR